jgi:hypothetical protein
MGDTGAQAIRIRGTERRTEGTKKGGTPQGGRLESVSPWRGSLPNPALQPTAGAERLSRLPEVHSVDDINTAARAAYYPPKGERGICPSTRSANCTKAHRQPPKPEQIDEVHEATLPDVCPDCGGPLDETHVAHQLQVEMPCKPIHRQFNIHVGRCRKCHRRVQGRHPLQTSDALGVAAAQLGPDAQAAVVELNKQGGLSHGKVTA